MIRLVIGRGLIGIGLLWMWFGPSITRIPDCNPRALFGCGLLDIGIGGMTAAMIGFASKFIVGAILIALGVVVQGPVKPND